MRSFPVPFRSLPLAVCAALGAPAAQEGAPPSAPPTPAEIRAWIRELEERQQDELEDVRFELETLQRQLAAAEAAARAKPQSASVFNPAITVFANLLARVDDERVYLDDDPAEPRLDDRFHLREVELDFRAPIDPWADGVVIGAFESEVPGEFDASIEEAYVVLKRLPVADSAPAGLRIKAGRFRAEFGRFNYVHLHDLPQPSYPRSLGTFLGEEGLVQDGVSGQFYLPSPSDSQSIEATVQLLNGGGLPLAEDLDGSHIAALGHLKWFQELGDASNLEVGLSGYSADSDHRLLGVDGTYKWKPLASGEWRSFLVGGELFAASVDDPALGDDPLGGYVWSQVQLDRNVYAGLRIDRTEELADAELATTTVGAYLTYYTTEFLRFRLGVEHTESDVAERDGVDTLLLEINTVFGSHPVEPYWVNR